MSDPIDEHAHSHEIITFPTSISRWGVYLKVHDFKELGYFRLSMLSPHTKERRWQGRPATTRLVHTVTTRVPIVSTPRCHTLKLPGKLPTGGWAHQNTSTTVFDFVPQPTFKCCKKKQCMSHFLSADDPRVTKARALLYDVELPSSSRRRAMREAWRAHLVIEHNGRSKPVCMTAATKIFVVARSSLNISAKAAKAGSSASRGVANGASAKKSVSVAGWLSSYKETLDVMPDQGWYMLPVARKGVLFGHYDLDAVAWPHLYERCKKNNFLNVWKTLFPEIRLRKHCRFAKCGFCVQMRELQTSGTATSDEKAVARKG